MSHEFKLYPDIEVIKEYLAIDESSPSGLVWIKQRGPAKAGDVAGRLHAEGYWESQLMGKLMKAHRIIWALHHGDWPNGQIDHINGIRSDNRIENIRDVNGGANQRNKKMTSRNSSGFTGVSFHSGSGRWRARIKVGGIEKCIGYFEDKNAASIAVCKERDRMGIFTKRHGK